MAEAAHKIPDTVEINYQAEPTMAKFHASPAFLRGIKGPIGSGKSVGCVLDLLSCAVQQQPDKNGFRKTRFAAIRNTYPELKSTTIKTWQDWVPEAIAPFKFDAPITCHVGFSPEGTTWVESEVLFLSCDRPKDVKKLKSLELTRVWLNEASELPKEILDMAMGRVGRYPSKQMGGSDYFGVIADTNPPDDDHWWYKLAEEASAAEMAYIREAVREATGKDIPPMEFFTQPGALIWDEAVQAWVPNQKAENIKNLNGGYGYYFQQLAGKTRQWIEVYIGGNYGKISEGRRVYPEFNDQIHVSKAELQPIEGASLILGQDFGLSPAASISQITPKGQFRALSEVVTPEHGSIGIRTFVNDYLKPHLVNHYGTDMLKGLKVWGDPAGTAKAQTDERTCFDELKAAGFDAAPAKTNSFIARRESVAWFLTRMVDGEPGFLLDPRCRYLRKGFNGGYFYRRIQVPGEEARYRDEPDKNRYSHVHDALQYGALSVGAVGVAVQPADMRPEWMRKMSTNRPRRGFMAR